MAPYIPLPGRCRQSRLSAADAPDRPRRGSRRGWLPLRGVRSRASGYPRHRRCSLRREYPAHVPGTRRQSRTRAPRD